MFIFDAFAYISLHVHGLLPSHISYWELGPGSLHDDVSPYMLDDRLTSVFEDPRTLKADLQCFGERPLKSTRRKDLKSAEPVQRKRAAHKKQATVIVGVIFAILDYVLYI